MEKELLEVEKGLFDENSTFDFKTDIRLIETESQDDMLISDRFLIKNELFKDIFTNDSQNLEIEFGIDERRKYIDAYSSGEVVISGWKNVENISARLIDYYDDTIIVECLIDKDVGIYEEREFRSTMFAGYKTEIGNLFLLRIFERQNEIRIEIHNDPGLTLKEDFPEFSFVDNFENSRLFKKK